MTGAEICVSPHFSSLAKRKYPRNTTINTTRFKTGIRQLERWNIMALARGIHFIPITEPVQRYLYPLSIF